MKKDKEVEERGRRPERRAERLEVIWGHKDWETRMGRCDNDRESGISVEMGGSDGHGLEERKM